MMLRTILLAALLALALPSQADARNAPCSGKKGSIAQCVGDKFVCNDGSLSASKKICVAPGRESKGLLNTPKAKSATSCDCRSGTFCTGPRGGTYCYSDSGKKNYVRE